MGGCLMRLGLPCDSAVIPIAFAAYLHRAASAACSVFVQFRHKYNTERPHEALKNAVPASLYVPSSKRYPCALRSSEYPADLDVYRAATVEEFVIISAAHGGSCNGSV